MPIVNHSLRSTTQANGSTFNVLRMYDQDAREFMISWNAPAGFDNSTKVSAAIVEMDEQLKTDEFEALVGGN